MLQRVKEVQESDLRMVGALARNIQRVLPVSQADIDAAAALGKGWVVWKVIEVTDPIDNLRGGTQLVIKQNSITPGQNVRRVLIVSGPGGETVVIGPGPSPLLLPSAVANSLSYVKAFGGTSQASTPTPDTPMDIVSNNGVLKYGQYGKNLFDLNTMDTHHGWWVNGSVINDTPSANRTIVIDCRPNTVYSFWHTEGAGGCRAFALNKDTIASGDTASWLTYGGPTFQAKDVVTKIKTPADAKKLYILAGRTEGAITRSFEEQLADFMVVEGEVEAALPYEPYHFGIHTDGTVETIKDSLNNTATAEMLLKVGDYQDVQSILDGAITRNVGVKVFDGTEEFALASGVAFRYILDNFPAGTKLMSNYFNGDVNPNKSITEMPDLSIKGHGTVLKNVYFKYTEKGTVEEFKQFLADQYAAGTPVIVLYPLATPTTESVAGQTLQVTGGDNTLTITQASLTGLELEAKYTKAV